MESKLHQLEKEAYRSVLAAFKAQSDTITWEKEGLVTELRKELRVSSDEHRELLARVNSNELIHRIRQRGSGQVDPIINSVQDSSSYKRKKSVQQISMSFDVPSGILHSQSVTTLQSPKIVTRPAQGNGDWPKLDTLIGRRLMTKWPGDNTFYEAVIRDYRSDEGRYGLVYDEGTSKETWEWVDLKEISPDYIRWISRDPLIDISTLDNNKKESRPSTTGQANTIDKFEILHTETLIHEVEKVISSSNPNLFKIEKAKKMLKEHEQSLIKVIDMLVNASNSDSESSNNVHR
ncbi:protein EMSY-LIKE 3-like isoform X2 [Impatiens glandulifera]|uniref:protein EMSY-LIKE 3-like isoform X2 n=1 Tax=Impatiens glandulifera TaxID=253017 RepID=UPI001FB0B5E9|nr:protein EMSY-LIKE 3-like isoform X2 [Impatiens glandulifera]